ncbi:DUF3793 family protein [Mobilitalea sibirica]|uniref:DUF3793 family protein n=1 Tax=Mobilitalea sibirica TaxID=1462919 RepID=A0A8J7H3P2_9FIRM|nr:DUF3793 family protein [Mobilitalea sibirica]MBH1941803.1 DUF3793 family protein [Mobilitalea sibirica]
MTKSTAIKYLERMSIYTEIDFILYKICFHAAPTIHRVKPASLICFYNSQTVRLKDMWDEYKHSIEELLPFQFREVKRCDKGVNVLFYWKDWMERIINNKKNSTYLNDMGYTETKGIEEVLDILSEHFKNGCPHEVGIFLGYPLSDVIAFSNGSNQDCLGVGYWKVYSNMPRAKKIFELYDKTHVHIIKSLERGVNPQNLFQNVAMTRKTSQSA